MDVPTASFDTSAIGHYKEQAEISSTHWLPALWALEKFLNIIFILHLYTVRQLWFDTTHRRLALFARQSGHLMTI